MKREDIRTISIAGTVENFEGDSHKEVLKQASNYEFPDVFDSRVQNISEDSTESIFICADRIPREPSGAQPDNIFVIDPQEEEWIIQTEFRQRHINYFLDLFDELLDDIKLEVNDLTVTSVFDTPFSEINVDIEAPAEFDSSGIQLVHESISHTIQSSEQVESAIQQSGSEIIKEYDREEEFCVVVSAVTEELSATDRDFLQESLEQIKETLSRVVPKKDD